MPETDSIVYVLEPKSRAKLAADDVIAKRDAAVKWCKQASDHANSHQGKPWRYVLIPHDVLSENVTLEWLATSFEAK